MNKNKTLKEFMELANRALELRRQTKNTHDAIFLKKIFIEKEFQKPEYPLEGKLRLLGNLYSVARTGDCEKMAEHINKTNLAKRFNDYKRNYNIDDLWHDLSDRKCGTKGECGEPTNKVISFLSKYGYFISGFNFPIYDKLARESLRLLKNAHKEFEIGEYIGVEKEKKFFLQYQDLLTALATAGETPTESTMVDTIDAFLWLYGIMASVKQPWCWSDTCGDLGGTDFANWYDDAGKFMRVG